MKAISLREAEQHATRVLLEAERRRQEERRRDAMDGVSYEVVQAERMKDPEFRKEYEKLEWEFRLIRLWLKLRNLWSVIREAMR